MSERIVVVFRHVSSDVSPFLAKAVPKSTEFSRTGNENRINFATRDFCCCHENERPRDVNFQILLIAPGVHAACLWFDGIWKLELRRHMRQHVPN